MITTQQELRDFLESRNIKIYERFAHNDYQFIIYYFDKKSNTVVFRDIASTPEISLRKFPKISKETALPVDDFDIVLIGAFNEITKEFINMEIDLDYHIYFKDEQKTEDTTSKE